MLRYEFDPPVEQRLSEDDALMLRAQGARRTRGGRIKASVELLNGSIKFTDEIDPKNHADRKRFYHGGVAEEPALDKAATLAGLIKLAEGMDARIEEARSPRRAGDGNAGDVGGADAADAVDAD